MPPGPPAPGGVTLSPEVRPGLPTALPRWRGAVTLNSELPLIWNRFDPCSLRHHTRPHGSRHPASLRPASPLRLGGSRSSSVRCPPVHVTPPPRAALSPSLVLLKICFALAYVNVSSVSGSGLNQPRGTGGCPEKSGHGALRVCGQRRTPRARHTSAPTVSVSLPVYPVVSRDLVA